MPLSARRHPLIAALAAALRDRMDVPHGSRVVVGVSGGADSLALLIGLVVIAQRREVRDRLVQKPIACCVHHHLRPRADAEVDHVQRVCALLGVPLVIEHVHPAAQAGNVQANARHMRYEALRGVAEQQAAPFIATAHHADDQAETLLMALARGAGLDGLLAMRWQRPLRADDPAGVQLIRPLLAARKAECEALCSAANIAWQHDASNDLIEPARTRVRHEVMPTLEALWPGAVGRMAASTETMALAAQVLEDYLAANFGPASQRTWPRALLGEQSTALRMALLRRAAVHAQPSAADALGQRQLREAAEAIGSHHEHRKQFDWPGGLVLIVAADAVTLRQGA